MNAVKTLGLIAMIGCLLGACSKPLSDNSEVNDTMTATTVTSTAAQDDSAEVMRKWAQSCALCHVSGAAGAPKVGDVVAWAPRLAKGKATLLKHTIEGYSSMPPLGYCMSCEEEDFSAMIDFMSGVAP